MKSRNSFKRGLASLFTIAFSIAATPAAQAASATWSAMPADALWSNTANWSATPVPGVGDTATFGGSTITTINTRAPTTTTIATAPRALGSFCDKTLASYTRERERCAPVTH